MSVHLIPDGEISSYIDNLQNSSIAPAIGVIDNITGLVQLSRLLFGATSPEHIYVQEFVREAGFKEPHFDVYEQHLHPDFPYIGSLTISGPIASLFTCVLDQLLSDAYRKMYPEATDEAYEARRLFAKIQSDYADQSDASTKVRVGTALIIPQVKGQRYLVHRVVSVMGAGRYVKLLVPKPSMVDDLISRGYTTLDNYLTLMSQLSDHSHDKDTNGDSNPEILPQAPPGEPIDDLVEEVRRAQRYGLNQEPAPFPARSRDCNLD